MSGALTSAASVSNCDAPVATRMVAWPWLLIALRIFAAPSSAASRPRVLGLEQTLIRICILAFAWEFTDFVTVLRESRHKIDRAKLKDARHAGVLDHCRVVPANAKFAMPLIGGTVILSR